MYSRSFIESHTVYIHDGAMDCAACAEEEIGELENRREDFRARADRFIDSGKVQAASEAAAAAAKAESDRAELADSAALSDDESDSPRSCDSCHAFIDGALTDRGMFYVAESIRDSAQFDAGSRAVVSEWAETYFPDVSFAARIVAPAVRRAILNRFARFDRERRRIERAHANIDGSYGRRYGATAGAADALRAAWVRFTYGGNDVRKTLTRGNR
jgi:hypothetical protein